MSDGPIEPDEPTSQPDGVGEPTDARRGEVGGRGTETGRNEAVPILADADGRGRYLMVRAIGAAAVVAAVVGVVAALVSAGGGAKAGDRRDATTSTNTAASHGSGHTTTSGTGSQSSEPTTAPTATTQSSTRATQPHGQSAIPVLTTTTSAPPFTTTTTGTAPLPLAPSTTTTTTLAPLPPTVGCELTADHNGVDTYQFVFTSRAGAGQTVTFSGSFNGKATTDGSGAAVFTASVGYAPTGTSEVDHEKAADASCTTQTVTFNVPHAPQG